MLFIACCRRCAGDQLCRHGPVLRTKAYLLRPVLALPYGLPSHDTFSRVFRMLDPRAFERCFRQFMTTFAEAANIPPTQGVVALDGKALRRGYERARAICRQSWSRRGAHRPAWRGAIVELLQLKGCVVTTDALHCRRAMAEAIVERGGDAKVAIDAAIRAFN